MGPTREEADAQKQSEHTRPKIPNSFLKNSMFNTQLTGKVFRFTDVGIQGRSKFADRKNSGKENSFASGSFGYLAQAAAGSNMPALSTNQKISLADISARKFSTTDATSTTQTSKTKAMRQLKQITDTTSGYKSGYLVTPHRAPVRLISDPSLTRLVTEGITSPKAGVTDSTPRVGGFNLGYQVKSPKYATPVVEPPETSFYHELVDLNHLKSLLRAVSSEREDSLPAAKKSKVYSERTRNSTQELSTWLSQQRQTGNNPFDKSRQHIEYYLREMVEQYQFASVIQVGDLTSSPRETGSMADRTYQRHKTIATAATKGSHSISKIGYVGQKRNPDPSTPFKIQVEETTNPHAAPKLDLGPRGFLKLPFNSADIQISRPLGKKNAEQVLRLRRSQSNIGWSPKSPLHHGNEEISVIPNAPNQPTDKSSTRNQEGREKSPAGAAIRLRRTSTLQVAPIKKDEPTAAPDEIEELSESKILPPKAAVQVIIKPLNSNKHQNTSLVITGPETSSIRPRQDSHGKRALDTSQNKGRSSPISLRTMTEPSTVSQKGSKAAVQNLEVKQSSGGDYFLGTSEYFKSQRDAQKYQKRKLLVKSSSRLNAQRNAGILERFEEDYHQVCSQIQEELQKLKSLECEDAPMLETFLREYAADSPIIKLLFVDGRLSLARTKEIFRLVEKRYGVTYNITPAKHGTIYEGKSKAEYFMSWTNLSKTDLARQKENQLRAELTQFKAEERLALPKLLMRLKKLCFEVKSKRYVGQLLDYFNSEIRRREISANWESEYLRLEPFPTHYNEVEDMICPKAKFVLHKQRSTLAIFQEAKNKALHELQDLIQRKLEGPQSGWVENEVIEKTTELLKWAQKILSVESFAQKSSQPNVRVIEAASQTQPSELTFE